MCNDQRHGFSVQLRVQWPKLSIRRRVTGITPFIIFCMTTLPPTNGDTIFLLVFRLISHIGPPDRFPQNWCTTLCLTIVELDSSVAIIASIFIDNSFCDIDMVTEVIILRTFSAFGITFGMPCSFASMIPIHISTVYFWKWSVVDVSEMLVKYKLGRYVSF